MLGSAQGSHESFCGVPAANLIAASVPRKAMFLSCSISISYIIDRDWCQASEGLTRVWEIIPELQGQRSDNGCHLSALQILFVERLC